MKVCSKYMIKKVANYYDESFTSENFNEKTSKRPDVTRLVRQDRPSFRVVAIGGRRSTDRRGTWASFATEISYEEQLLKIHLILMCISG
jgi:hypothetical protein